MRARNRFAALAALALFLSPAYAQTAFKPDDPKISEPARNYDLIHLRVELRIDVDAKSFAGEAINTIRPLFDGVRAVRFDAVGLEVEAVTANGKALRTSPFEEEPRKGIEVELDRAYGESETVDVAIRYSGKDPEKGLYFIQPDADHPEKPFQVWSQGEDMDTRYWIPTYDYPNDRATTEFFFTLREPLHAVSNGTLLAVTPAGEADGKRWRTFHWKMDQPYVTYLIAIGAADWEKHVDLLDLPGRAAPLSVEYYVNRGVGEATARRSYGETPRMIRFFSEKTGVPFPWDKYAQVTVTDFVVGGMENVSVTLNTDRTLHDDRAHLDQTSRGLVAHELAHQWWGDYLTCRRWADIWLNEGFATYFQCLYEREAEGEDSFRVAMRGNQAAARNSEKEKPRPIVETFVDPESRGRGNAVYVKGASVLYMLHRMLGEELWWKAIHHYASKHAFGVVDTHDFEIAIREATGRNFDWFFQQYVYLGGYPEFEIAQDWDPEAKQLRLAVKQTQKVEGIRPLFRMPVDIGITTAEGTKTYKVWCDAAEQNLYFPVESRPLMIRFDKDSWILKTVKFERPLEMLAYQLENDPDVAGRLEAAEALGEKKEEAKGLLPALARALRSDRHHSVRGAAAAALGKIRGPEAKGALLAGLKDAKPQVRRQCVEALASFEKDPEVAEALVPFFRSEPSYATQAAALKTLVKADPDRSRAYITEGLGLPSHHDQLAAAAVGLLAESKDAETISTIRGYLEGKDARPRGAAPSEELQSAAVQALAKIGKDSKGPERKEILDAILKYGEGRKNLGRSGVISALSALGDKAAVPFLEKVASGNARRNVRESAKRALEQLEEKKKDKEGARAGANLDSLKKEIEKLRQQVESLEKRLAAPAAER